MSSGFNQYRYWIESDRDKAVFDFVEKQKKYERWEKKEGVWAVGGLFVSTFFMRHYFGETVAIVWFIGAIVCYFLGSSSVQKRWDKEKDRTEFSEALADYDKAHPNQDSTDADLI